MAIDKKKAESMCICKGCPSWKECKEKIAFCMNAKSKCIKEKQGCICGGCEVHREMKFSKYYYCLEGKE